jgi:hypothetical protein
MKYLNEKSSSAVLSDAFHARCVVNASGFLQLSLKFPRVKCGILLAGTCGRGWKSSDFYFNQLVQYLILPSQNYQIKFKGLRMFISSPVQIMYVLQTIQHQPV